VVELSFSFIDFIWCVFCVSSSIISVARTNDWVLFHTFLIYLTILFFIIMFLSFMLILRCPGCECVTKKFRYPCGKCHHIKCPVCQHEFCYVCLGPWRQNDGGFFSRRPCNCPMFCSENCQSCDPCPDYPNCSCQDFLRTAIWF
jgi:hypothetical protein